MRTYFEMLFYCVLGDLAEVNAQSQLLAHYHYTDVPIQKQLHNDFRFCSAFLIQNNTLFACFYNWHFD